MGSAQDDRSHADVARQRVQRLLELAEDAALDDRFDDADRYAKLAWRITTRHTLTASDRLKARVCRGCKGFLLPGVTARTRVTEGKLSSTCKRCGRTRRIPLEGSKGR